MKYLNLVKLFFMLFFKGNKLCLIIFKQYNGLVTRINVSIFIMLKFCKGVIRFFINCFIYEIYKYFYNFNSCDIEDSF